MLKAHSFLVSLALICWLALAPWAVAQSLPTLQDHTKDQDQNQDQSMETLKVQVNVVQLFFNVKDKKGGLIPDQKKEDFELFEDGKPQTIKYFTAGSQSSPDARNSDRHQRQPDAACSRWKRKWAARS